MDIAISNPFVGGTKQVDVILTDAGAEVPDELTIYASSDYPILSDISSNQIRPFSNHLAKREDISIAI